MKKINIVLAFIGMFLPSIVPAQQGEAFFPRPEASYFPSISDDDWNLSVVRNFTPWEVYTAFNDVVVYESARGIDPKQTLPIFHKAIVWQVEDGFYRLVASEGSHLFNGETFSNQAQEIGWVRAADLLQSSDALSSRKGSFPVLAYLATVPEALPNLYQNLDQNIQQGIYYVYMIDGGYALVGTKSNYVNQETSPLYWVERQNLKLYLERFDTALAPGEILLSKTETLLLQSLQKELVDANKSFSPGEQTQIVLEKWFKQYNVDIMNYRGWDVWSMLVHQTQIKDQPVQNSTFRGFDKMERGVWAQLVPSNGDAIQQEDMPLIWKPLQNTDASFYSISPKDLGNELLRKYGLTEAAQRYLGDHGTVATVGVTQFVPYWNHYDELLVVILQAIDFQRDQKLRKVVFKELAQSLQRYEGVQQDVRGAISLMGCGLEVKRARTEEQFYNSYTYGVQLRSTDELLKKRCRESLYNYGVASAKKIKVKTYISDEDFVKHFDSAATHRIKILKEGIQELYTSCGYPEIEVTLLRVTDDLSRQGTIEKIDVPWKKSIANKINYQIQWIAKK